MLLDRRQLPLNALRSFEAAGRHPTLTAAADELGVTHAAISRQILLLEEQLCVQLFDRSNRKLKLTPAGERLLKAVSDGFDQISDTISLLDSETMSGSLIWATTPTATKTLMGVAGSFQKKHPEVEMHLTTIPANSEMIPSNIDVCVCFGLPKNTNLELIELYQEEFFPVCSPKLLAPNKPQIDMEKISSYTLIHDEHDRWSDWYQQQGMKFSKVKSNFIVNEAHLAISAAVKGIGIAYADKMEVRDELADGRLIRIHNGTLLSNTSYYIAYKSSESLNIKTRTFVEWLRKSFVL